MNILITNDDGLRGKGLFPLVNEIRKIADVTVVVPEYDRSAVSHSITLNKPLQVKEMQRMIYAADGTPADCVRFGVIYLLKKQVDLVISGINSGPNLGQDVIYSGTVAGAREGALLGIPAFAISVSDMYHPRYPAAARLARELALKIARHTIPQGAYLNVNVPPVIKGVKLVSLGNRVYDDDIECRKDPRGRKYFWLAGKTVSGILQAGMDVTAVDQGYAAVTPLLVTPPSRHLFKSFQSWMHGFKSYKK